MKDERKTDLAPFIDHTLLAPDCSKKQIETLCQEALQHQFASVCVSPTRVELAAKLLTNSTVKVCTVIGFPHGTQSLTAKLAEVDAALQAGATELDVVLYRGAAVDGNWPLLEQELREIRTRSPVLLKAILETSNLPKDLLAPVAERVIDAGWEFLKTSTGFGTGGANEETVAELVRIASERSNGRVKVKASGGIRDRASAELMVRLGATRIGTSSGVSIVLDGLASTSTSY